MPIYTRTGDRGRTSLFNGQRVSKADLRVETYGTIDELNSALGVVLSSKYLVLSIKKELIRIQSDLLEIGSNLANPASRQLKYLQKRVKKFENFIDWMTQNLPPLENFILPSGGKAGAMLHLARAICRRSERKIVELNNKHPSAGSFRLRSGQARQADKNIIIYLNRLSDLLFTMARFVNFKEKKKEIIWIKK